MLKYNNRKIKAKNHLVSKVCPSKPVGEKGEGRKGEKRKERREKGKKIVEQGGRCDFFSSPSSFPSALQVVARERSQRKPRTSKFLMVGKLGFDVFHVQCLEFSGMDVKLVVFKVE